MTTTEALTIAEKLDGIAALKGARVAFDGCHKLYLILNEGDAMAAPEYGYSDGDIHPVTEIRRLWEESCALRFVSLISLEEHPFTIEQFEEEDEND